MRLLLDTHAVLWFDGADRRLSRTARAALEQPDADLVVSATSIWEMAIKSSLDRLRLPRPVSEYVLELQTKGYRITPVTGVLAAAVAPLPHHHKDPFDRLLIAQALAEDLPVVTRDRVFKKYGVNVIW